MEINEYLVKFFQVVRDMENMDFFAGVARLSRTEFRLLREVIMEEEKGRSIISSELARRLGITRSAISQIVTKLELKGIVKRIDSPTDRKIAYIRLSENTISVFEDQCKEANAIMARVVELLGDDKMKAFFAQYEELSTAINKAIKEAKGQ